MRRKRVIVNHLHVAIRKHAAFKVKEVYVKNKKVTN